MTAWTVCRHAEGDMTVLKPARIDRLALDGADGSQLRTSRAVHPMNGSMVARGLTAH